MEMCIKELRLRKAQNHFTIHKLFNPDIIDRILADIDFGSLDHYFLFIPECKLLGIIEKGG